MRRFVITALTAVFFSLGLSGCYTKFGGPEPGMGEQTYQDYDYAYDHGLYLGYSYYPYYDLGGWYGPRLLSYPYFSYGYFYSPWWYDPWYYYDGGNHNYRRSRKSIRSRRSDNTFSPMAAGYSPRPPALSGGGSPVVRISQPSVPTSGKSLQPSKTTRSSGKSTRRRR